MKKTILFTLTVFMLINTIFIGEIHASTAAEDDIVWLNKKYDYVYSFVEGMAVVRIGNKYGFIDKNGKEVVQAKYYYAEDFSEGLAMVMLNGKTGFIDKSGKEVIPLKYDDPEIVSDFDFFGFKEGLARVNRNYKWGFIDKGGKEVIPLKYDYVERFNEGMATVRLNGKYGFIDKSGKQIVPLKYDYVEDFNEGMAMVQVNDKYGFIDKSGKEVIALKYDLVSKFSEGLAAAMKGNYGNYKFGYVDKTGKEVIPLKYDYITIGDEGEWLQHDFHEGITMMRQASKYSMIDKSGKEIFPLKYVDEISKKTILSSQVVRFNEGLALISKGSLDNYKWGFIDKTGKEIIPLKYDNAKKVQEGLAVVAKGKWPNSKYGFIDKNGNEVVSFKYDYAGSFQDGVSVIELNNKLGILKNPLKTKTKDETSNQSIIAKTSNAKVLVNGKEVLFDSYLINDNNYFKLRDLANVLSETEKNFDVTWDGKKDAINLISNKIYRVVGGEMAKGNDKNQPSKLSTSSIYKDGNKLEIVGYTINENNYFKLRDVAKAFDIGITWDNKTKAIGIDTRTSYIE